MAQRLCPIRIIRFIWLFYIYISYLCGVHFFLLLSILYFVLLLFVRLFYFFILENDISCYLSRVERLCCLPFYRHITYNMAWVVCIYRLALGTKMNRPRDELVKSGGRTNNFRLAPIHYVFQCLYGFYSIMHRDDNDDMFRKRCRSDRPTRRKRRRMAHFMHLISETKSRALLILILSCFYFFFRADANE